PAPLLACFLVQLLNIEAFFLQSPPAGELVDPPVLEVLEGGEVHLHVSLKAAPRRDPRLARGGLIEHPDGRKPRQDAGAPQASPALEGFVSTHQCSKPTVDVSVAGRHQRAVAGERLQSGDKDAGDRLMPWPPGIVDGTVDCTETVIVALDA